MYFKQFSITDTFSTTQRKVMSVLARFVFSPMRYADTEPILKIRLFQRGVHTVSQEECARLREGVPYVKVYRYNPKHLCPKLNGYGDNGQRKVWSSCGSTHCTCLLTIVSISVLECGVIWRQFRFTLATQNCSQPCYVIAGHSHV